MTNDEIVVFAMVITAFAFVGIAVGVTGEGGSTMDVCPVCYSNLDREGRCTGCGWFEIV